MDEHGYVRPLPYASRRKFFMFLVLVFVVVLPFLYLYATGYRFDMRRPTNLVSTGGIYVSVDKTGAEIYIDGELVRETRAFRRAFYAQSLDIGTHRVHVQKEGHHTWVKELPVSRHRVTEALAFNMPLIPQVRVLSPFLTATGSAVVNVLPTHVVVMNEVVATTTATSTRVFIPNPEFEALMLRFTATSSTTTENTRGITIGELIGRDTATTTAESSATSTVISSGVRLSMEEEELYASWVGPFEEMPYYYCAPDFPPVGAPTTTDMLPVEADEEEEEVLDGFVMHPVQTIPEDAECEPTIRIDRKGQEVRGFHFFPGSTDLVLVVLEDGIYVVEVDDRSWQNVQPLIVGEDLRMHIENGNIFVYDKRLIYQVLLNVE